MRQKYLHRRFIYYLICSAIFFVSTSISAQKTDQPTGKSYDTTQVKRPTATAPQYPSPVTFTDFTVQSKINFRHNSSPTSRKYLPETMGAGVALIDFDNDGLLDVFFTNGAEISDPMPKNKTAEKTNAKYWNRLYRRKKDGSFEDVTEKSNLKGEGYSFGVAVGDYDRDGFQDIFVTRLGGANLYRNNGDGTFSDVTKKLGINVNGWAVSTGFFDYDRDGRLDIFIGRYAVWDFEIGAIFCGDSRPGFRAYCHPDNFASVSNVLLHQKSDGTFEDVSEKSGISKSLGKALGVAFADFDDDGWTDIFVANDNADQQLFRNTGKGNFEEIALSAGVAFDDQGKRFAGMGTDAADYDGDGKQDLIVTALPNQTYPIYKNAGDWIFDFVTQTSGIAQITMLGSGWGIKFIDADNDGRRDLIVAQGHVLDTIEKTNSYLKYKQSTLLLRNTEKGFQDVSVSAGEIFTQNLSARGLACGDLDNDGDVDFFIAQNDAAPVIIKNNGTKNHWIGLDLRGEKSAPNGEGARVVVTDSKGKKQFFDVSNSGSYLSANDSRVLVGLGENSSVRSIEIKWSSGEIQTIENPQIDKYHVLKESKK